MNGLKSIEQNQVSAAAAEAARKKQPFVFFDPEEVKRVIIPGENGELLSNLPFHEIGEFVPYGWEKAGKEWDVQTVYLDDHAFRLDGTLTVKEFIDELTAYTDVNDGFGFGLVESRPGSVLVRAFKKVAA